MLIKNTLDVFYISLVSDVEFTLPVSDFRSQAPGLVAGKQSFSWRKDMRSLNPGKRSWHNREGYSVLSSLLLQPKRSWGKPCTFSPCILRKLREQKDEIELELEEVFSASVSAAIVEAEAAPASSEVVASIVLGVLLAITLVAFLVYVLLDLKRKRYRGLALAM